MLFQRHSIWRYATSFQQSKLEKLLTNPVSLLHVCKSEWKRYNEDSEADLSHESVDCFAYHLRVSDYLAVGGILIFLVCVISP